MIELTPVQRREFRAKAHHLNPVVTIGSNGLTDTVVAEIDRSLQAHELIKIRVQGAEHEQRDVLMLELCTTLDAAPVQHIGNILVVWRERREVEKTAAASQPKPAAKSGTAKSAAAFAAAARRAALAKAAAESRRSPARGPGLRSRSSSGGRGR